jgi:hypothetical protein
MRMVTSRSERPASIAKRLIGVTRMRSTTPLRISATRPKPAKAAAKNPVMISSPGTNQLKALPVAPAAPVAPSSSGPNSSR